MGFDREIHRISTRFRIFFCDARRARVDSRRALQHDNRPLPPTVPLCRLVWLSVWAFRIMRWRGSHALPDFVRGRPGQQENKPFLNLAAPFSATSQLTNAMSAPNVGGVSLFGVGAVLCLARDAW